MAIFSLIFAALFVILSFAVLWVILTPYVFTVSKLPGPKPTSFWNGNFWEIYHQPPCEPQLQFANANPDSGILRYFFWFNRPSVLLYGANEIKHVLITNVADYDSKPFGDHPIFHKFFAEGLLMMQGDIHRLHRKMIQPAFNYSNLKEMVPIFAKKGAAWSKMWHDNIQKMGSVVENGNYPILQVDTEMSNLTLDIIGLCGFGVDFNSISDVKGRKANAYKGFIGHFTLSLKMLIPGWFYLPLKENNDLQEWANEIEEMISGVIKNKRQTKASPSGSKDLMDLLLEAYDEETKSIMTDKQLFNHVMTFMTAGHETTSVALSWLFYSLSQHPDYDARLYQEIKDVDFSNITIEKLDQLHFLNNVVKETLRLYPPAPLLSRTALKDDVVSGYKIPKGTRIIISPGVTHRIKKYWGETALEFDPDRWDTPFVKEGVGANNYLYMPFMLGPRQCIGNKFALLELRTLTGILLQNFRFELKSDTKVTPKLSVTMKPSPGLPMHIIPRSLSRFANQEKKLPPYITL